MRTLPLRPPVLDCEVVRYLSAPQANFPQPVVDNENWGNWVSSPPVNKQLTQTRRPFVSHDGASNPGFTRFVAERFPLRRPLLLRKRVTALAKIMSFGAVKSRGTSAFVRSLLVATGLLATPCTARLPPDVLDAQPSLDKSRAVSESTECDDFPLDPEAPLDLPVGPETGR